MNQFIWGKDAPFWQWTNFCKWAYFYFVQFTFELLQAYGSTRYLLTIYGHKRQYVAAWYLSELLKQRHGQACSDEKYLQLPDTYGVSELVQGFLAAKPKADADHATLTQRLNYHVSV